jgi:hypothetical protein
MGLRPGARAAEAQLVQRAADGAQELLVGEGLGEILLGARLDRRHGALDGGVPGYHHHLGVSQVLLDEAD